MILIRREKSPPTPATPAPPLSVRAPALLIWLAFLVFVAAFSRENARRYDAYAYIHDINIFEQTYWETIHGRPMANSYVGNHFSTHFSPMMFLLAPFYALAPSAKTLLLLIVCIVGLAGVALFHYARDAWGDPWAALAIGLAFLLHPIVHGMALSGFQEMKFGIPLFVLFFWQLAKGNFRNALLLMFLLLLSRQDLAASTACAGLYWMAFGRQWRQGLVVLTISVVWLVAVPALIISHFAHGPWSGTEHITRFAALGDSPAAILQTIVGQPWRILGMMFDTSVKRAYPPAMLTPLLWTPLLGWSALWIAAPSLAINLLSSYRGQHIPITHYSSMVLAVCFVSVVVGLNRPQLTAKAWRIRAAAALIALGCAAGMFAESNVYDRRAAAPEFAWRTFDQASLAALAEIEAALPANASLAASWSVASHFARRDKLLHVFWLPETFIEGRYDFALLDRLDPNFTPKEDMPALTAALAADYRLIKGKPGDRILLLVRKDYVSR